MSSLAKTVLRAEAMEYVKEYMKGIMKGKTMMIGFFTRGPVGAQATMPAIEISSSTYVLHSGELLYRNCYEHFDAEVERKEGIFYTNVHSEGPNRPEDVPNARVFMDRNWFTTFSTFSLESISLLQQARYEAFLAYIGVSLLGCLAATAAGMWLSKSLV